MQLEVCRQTQPERGKGQISGTVDQMRVFASSQPAHAFFQFLKKLSQLTAVFFRSTWGYKQNLLFAAALAVCATASPHERRQGEGGIWNPKITSPNDKTVWCVGKTVKVTWDTSGKPQNFNDNPAIFLFSDIDFKLSETLKDWKSFSLNAGSIDVKVPEVKDGKEYFINLASDSGNRSPKFSIKHC